MEAEPASERLLRRPRGIPMLDAWTRCRCAFLSFVLIAFATTGCAPGLHSVRFRTADGQERTTVPRPRAALAVADMDVQRATASLAREVVPVADPLEFARQRFGFPLRGGALAFNLRARQLTRLDDVTAAEAQAPEKTEQVRRYLQWCQNIHQPGDCLRILRNGVLDAHGRYAVAMAIAQGHTLEAMKASLKDMANPEAVMAMLVSGMTVYMMLWILPEPVSKGIAAAMTVILVAYLGVDTLYTLGRGWKALVDRADAATTFDQLREAGEEFAKVMGADTARILVMVATAAMGSGAAGLAEVAPTLPGAVQASRLAVAEGSVELAAVGAAETVTIGESGLTIALAPGAAVQTSFMVDSSTGGGSSGARPSRAERIAELAKDKDRGVKKDDETVLREAEVAVDMEEQGRLKRPVRRPVRDDGHSGDIVDGNGQDWDIKRPHSRAQLEESIRQRSLARGEKPPTFDPGKPIGGQFDLKETLKNIHREFGSGEKVIIDTSKLNSADLPALRQALIDERILGTQVLLYP